MLDAVYATSTLVGWEGELKLLWAYFIASLFSFFRVGGVLRGLDTFIIIFSKILFGAAQFIVHYLWFYLHFLLILAVHVI